MKKTLLVIGLAIIASVNNINAQAPAAPAVQQVALPNLTPGTVTTIVVDNKPTLFKVQLDGDDIRLVNLEALAARTPSVAPAAQPVVIQSAPAQTVVAAAPAPAQQNVRYVTAPAAAPQTTVAAAPAKKEGPTLGNALGSIASSSVGSGLNNGIAAEVEGRANTKGQKVGFGRAFGAGTLGGLGETVVKDGGNAIFGTGANIFTGKK